MNRDERAAAADKRIGDLIERWRFLLRLEPDNEELARQIADVEEYRREFQDFAEHLRRGGDPSEFLDGDS